VSEKSDSDADAIAAWRSWRRLENAKAASWGYARFLEPHLRDILPHLEKINDDIALLNRHLIHAWCAEGWWTINEADQIGTTLRIAGVLVPPNLAPVNPVIVANGRVVKKQATSLPSPLDERLMPVRPQHYGFTAELPDTNLQDLNRSIELNVATKGQKSRLLLARHKSMHFAQSWGPIPPASLLRRVGSLAGNPNTWLVFGSTFIAKLDQLSLEYLKKPLAGLDAILDWGCGCGRMLRFFEPEVRPKVSGVDIDPVSIGWCKENLPGPQYFHVPKQPPLPFPDESFDVVYGNSVFTHLSEAHQFTWLEELKRIVKPGGIAAVTVHARTSWCDLGWFEAHALLMLLSHGMRTADVPNPDLADVAGEFYTDSHHTHDYIYTHWGKYFEVCQILENFSSTQAMVVLRKNA
jgi:SAM-dependent methyltransferase